MGTFIASVLFFAVALLQHERIETLGLTAGLNFTYSIILPFLVEMALLAWILFNTDKAFLQDKSRGLKRVIIIFILIAGGGIAFLINPLSESVYKNTYRKVIVSSEKAENFEQGLTMFVSSDCELCLEKIKLLNRVKEYNPQLNIQIQFVGKDNDSYNQYNEMLTDGISLKRADDLASIKMIIAGKYPSFFYKSGKNSQELVHWYSEGFGAAAIDWIVEGE